MNNFRSLIYSIFSLLFLGIVSCNENVSVDSVGEGSISFNYDMGTTKASLSDDELEQRLENYILKIYSYESGSWELIRYYSPAYEIPEAIYLNAGSYKATISLQVDYEPVSATTDSDDFVYYGEEEFEIVGGQENSVTIQCNLINTVLKLVYNFDALEGAEYDGNSVTYNNEIIITDITSYAYIDGGDEFDFDELSDATYVKYNNSGDIGYYYCDESDCIVWGTTYLKNELVGGEYEQTQATGFIKNPAPATLYTITLKYTESSPGYLSINVIVNEDEITEFEDDFSFSPQPTISGEGTTTVFTYVDGTYTYSISSLQVLDNVSIERDGETIEIYNDGAAVEGVSGVEEVTISEDGLTGTLTLNSDFFTTFNAGGEQSFTILATDNSSSVGSQDVTVNVPGMLKQLTDADYWNNTGTFKAFVTSSSVSNVTVYARRKGNEDWNEYSASDSGTNSVYNASITPVWKSFNNVNNLTVDTLQMGISVGVTYECKMEVDGVQMGGIAEVTAGGEAQSIPYGTMESSLPCFSTSSSSSSTSWGSGNNTFTNTLCTQVTKDDSKVAKLLSTEASNTYAAGNLFLGQFEFSISSTSGTVSFGQAFTWESRPKALKLKYAASLEKMTENYGDGLLVSGENDKARVYLCIVDWSSRREVTSGNGTPTGTWDPEAVNTLSGCGNIIGYASQFITESTTGDGMHSLEIPIYYYDTVTKPSSTYGIVISAVTSAYGDYLVGAVGTTLWVDDFELVY